MKTAYQKYKTTSIQSASREKLLLMLYEGAIRYVKKAKKAIEEKDIAEKGMNIGRAYDIIMELNNTLDHKVGGEVALHLEQLYMFMTDELTKANVTSQIKHLDSVLKILEKLYSAWVGAIDTLKNKDGFNQKTSTTT